MGSIPGSGRSSGRGNGNPLQYSWLENPMNRGAWQLQSTESQRVGHDLETKQQQNRIRIFVLFTAGSLAPCCCSVPKWWLTLCDPMYCSTAGFLVLLHLREFVQTHVYWVSDAIQSFHSLLSPSPPAFHLSQHQGLFQWDGSSHQVAKVLELQLQHQSFQWISGLISFRIDWFDLLAVQGTFKSLLQHHSSKASILWRSAFFMVQLSHLYMTTLAPRTGISTQKVLKKQLLDEKMNKPGLMKAWLELGWFFFCFFCFFFADETGVEKTPDVAHSGSGIQIWPWGLWEPLVDS